MARATVPGTAAVTALRPLDPMQRIEMEMRTEDNGFGLPQGERDGWHAFRGLAIPATLWIARTDDTWLVGIAHQGVMASLAAAYPQVPVARPDGDGAFAAVELAPIVRRMARLARSLPPQPLEIFRQRTRDLPETTEAERLVVQRIGQDVFRDALMDFWGGRCPLTGISHPRLLRASHMKPWAACETPAERLDVHNGLLLAAHLDAAFDSGLITFEDDGTLVASPALSGPDREALSLARHPELSGLKPEHLPFLAWHRARVFTWKRR